MQAPRSAKETIIEVVIRPMRAMFRPPRDTSDEVLALEHYTRHLAQFERADLVAGWDRFVETYRKTSWPPVAELIQHCQMARAERTREQATAEQVDPEAEQRERRKRCEAALRSPLGQQACDEGWQLGLWHFVEREGRSPNGYEIRRLKADHDGFLADMGRLATSERPLDRQLYQLGIRMQARAGRMARGIAEPSH
jgi:hypothetical protein